MIRNAQEALFYSTWKKANDCTVRVQKQPLSWLLPVSPSRKPHRREGRAQEDGGSGLVGLVGGRPAGLQHLLHQVEADARLALVLGDGEVVEEVEVAHVGAVRVAVLVHQPLPLGGVGVPRADVLGLQVLQLTVDGVAVRHGAASRAGRRAESRAAGGADGPGRRELFRRAQQRFPPLFLPQCPTGARRAGPAGSCSLLCAPPEGRGAGSGIIKY